MNNKIYQIASGIWMDEDDYRKQLNSDNILQIRIGKKSISVDLMDDNEQQIQGVSEDL